MQLEKTDGGTHSDDITGNDADAGKIRRRKTTDPPLPLRDYFDSGPCPAMPCELRPGSWTWFINGT